MSANESTLLLSILIVGFGSAFALNMNVYFNQRKEIKELKTKLKECHERIGIQSVHEEC